MLRTFILTLHFTLFLFVFLFAQTNPNHVWVNGYTKSNGTYVRGHWRTAPNHTNVDNFSTRGNTNPYTGQRGWVTPDGEANPWNTQKELQELLDEIVEVQPYKKKKAAAYTSSYSTSSLNAAVPASTSPTVSTPNRYVRSSTSSNTNSSYTSKPITSNRKYTSNSAYGSNSTTSVPKKTAAISKMNQTWYSKGDQVNVRFDSNLKSKIAYRLNLGDELNVLSKSNRKSYVNGYGEDYWYEIEVNGVTGWVFGKLIGTMEYDQTSPDQWDGEFMYVKGNYVNCRTEPSTKVGKVLLKLNKNDRIELIAKTNNEFSVDGYEDDYWYYVRAKDKQGWIFGALLETIN